MRVDCGDKCAQHGHIADGGEHVVLQPGFWLVR
jgi:hypothetical protein